MPIKQIWDLFIKRYPWGRIIKSFTVTLELFEDDTRRTMRRETRAKDEKRLGILWVEDSFHFQMMRLVYVYNTNLLQKHSMLFNNFGEILSQSHRGTIFKGLIEFIQYFTGNNTCVMPFSFASHTRLSSRCETLTFHNYPSVYHETIQNERVNWKMLSSRSYPLKLLLIHITLDGYRLRTRDCSQ